MDNEFGFLNKIKEEGKEVVKIIVYKKNNKSGIYEYIKGGSFPFEVNENTEIQDLYDVIAQKFGSGEYKIIVKSKKGEGTITCSIANIEPEEPKPQQTLTAFDILKIIEERDRKFLEILKEFSKPVDQSYFMELVKFAFNLSKPNLDIVGMINVIKDIFKMGLEFGLSSYSEGEGEGEEPKSITDKILEKIPLEKIIENFISKIFTPSLPSTTTSTSNDTTTQALKVFYQAILQYDTNTLTSMISANEILKNQLLQYKNGEEFVNYLKQYIPIEKEEEFVNKINIILNNLKNA